MKRKKTEHVVDAAEPLAPGAGLSLVPSIDTVQLAVEVEEAKDVLVMVKEFQIVNQPDMNFANECLVDVKGRLEHYEVEKKRATAPMNEALKVVRGWFKPLEDFYGQAEDIWKDKIGTWHLAEAERQRQALAAVQQAHKAGDVQGVATAMAVAAQSTIETPTNLTVKEVWKFTVTDPAAVPREYCSPDANKIKAVVEALGDKANIPGVSVSLGTSIIARRPA